MTSLTPVSGSGSFKDATLISFSYSEDATPLDPYDLDGGTGQVTASVVSEEDPRGTRVAINNLVQLSDEEFGDVSFTVRKVSINENLATVTGETAQSKLNVERTAGPQGSDAGGYTLYEAIIYYCSLVDIHELTGTVSTYSSLPDPSTENSVYRTLDTGRLYVYKSNQWVETDACLRLEASVQAKTDAISIDFIGWQGNVWEYLKMLCAACPIDEDDNTLLEMYVENDELWFREGLNSPVDLSEYVSDESIEIDSYDAAQEVTVSKYTTDYRADSLIRQEGVQSSGFANLENVSITDSMQVSANEKIVRRIKVNASLESVNQPVPVFSITSVPYSGVTGEYVIVGSDSVPILPEQWLEQGGLLEVGITENPNEIEITIVGANFPEREPFRIGVEASDGQDYPALYVTGTGVFFERTQHTLLTGAAPSADVSAPAIDNPFITDDNKLWTRGVAAAQGIVGPKYQLNQSIARGGEFGTLVGSTIDAFDTRFRITSASFSQSGTSLTANRHVTFADFDAAWNGNTFQNFNDIMDGLSFDEFSIVPLSKEI